MLLAYCPSRCTVGFLLDTKQSRLVRELSDDGRRDGVEDLPLAPRRLNRVDSL